MKAMLEPRMAAARTQGPWVGGFGGGDDVAAAAAALLVLVLVLVLVLGGLGGVGSLRCTAASVLSCWPWFDRRRPDSPGHGE
jgi:hypothetical protein